MFKRSAQGVYFAMMKDSFGKWAFPKGHIRRGESYRKGAEREVREELGLESLALVKPLGHIDIWFRDRFVHKGVLVHKYIYYFLFEAPEGARLRKPTSKEAGEKIQAVAWVSAKQLLRRSSYRDMTPVITRALRTLEGQD